MAQGLKGQLKGDGTWGDGPSVPSIRRPWWQRWTQWIQRWQAQGDDLALDQHVDQRPHPPQQSVPVPSLGKSQDMSQAAPEPPPSSTLPNWWPVIQRHSQLLVAVVNLQNHQIEWSSDRFRALVGLLDRPPVAGDAVLTHLSPAEQEWVRERIRRHVLKAILTEQYQQQRLVADRWLYEPLIVTVGQATQAHPRYVEFTVSSDRIVITHLDPEVRSALTDCWSTTPDLGAVMTQIHQPDSPLQQVLQRINPQTYRASGTVLLEGMDVTDREVAQRLGHLLLQRESILQPQRFSQANALMQRLFRAQDTLILTAEEASAKIFLDLDQPEWTVLSYPVDALQESRLFQAACRGEVLKVSDLSAEPLTPCEQLLRDRGTRSLLMLPLAIRSPRLQGTAQLVGLVALGSDQIDGFDTLDESHAAALVSALTVAMRHTVQDRFTNIHESVRWRFEEEAERRSLGMTPEPIVFQNVYPLYGISDIRGSSDERNRAIQTDLMTQFTLAAAVVTAVSTEADNAYIHQFRLDLEEQVATLQQGVTVDAEVTLLRYLQENVESHFDYFSQCGDGAVAAIAAYKAAQDSEQGCVYAARAVYDRTIHDINQALRATWQQWQRTMQTIARHYCDIEATDGIDHMVYAGQSIDPSFTPFHLRSLRYEQLRAVCDCARTAFRLKAEHSTKMDITHLVLVQDSTVDITHDENTERLFDVRGTRDTRYEIVKKRIDKALDSQTQARITQPGCLTLVYSTGEEWQEYQQYLRYLQREGWVDEGIEQGTVEPLQGVTGLKFARVRVLPAPELAGA